MSKSTTTHYIAKFIYPYDERDVSGVVAHCGLELARDWVDGKGNAHKKGDWLDVQDKALFARGRHGPAPPPGSIGKIRRSHGCCATYWFLGTAYLRIVYAGSPADIPVRLRVMYKITYVDDTFEWKFAPISDSPLKYTPKDICARQYPWMWDVFEGRQSDRDAIYWELNKAIWHECHDIQQPAHTERPTSYVHQIDVCK